VHLCIASIDNLSILMVRMWTLAGSTPYNMPALVCSYMFHNFKELQKQKTAPKMLRFFHVTHKCFKVWNIAMMK